MKRGTPGHPKMLQLAEILKIPLPYAVGIMEMLWQATAQYAPRGDIGRFDDKHIAALIQWPKQPSLLVSALVASGFLDVNVSTRYLVHDWEQHADRGVRQKLKNAKQCFYEVSGNSGAKSEMHLSKTESDVVLPSIEEKNITEEKNIAPEEKNIAPEQNTIHAREEKTFTAAACGNGHTPPSTDASPDHSNGPSNGNGGNALIARYREFIKLWSEPTEDGRVFTCADVDLGSQIWISLVDSGRINAANVEQVFAGLKRYKQSERWRSGYVLGVPSFLGWAKNGTPAAPRWNDLPKPAAEEC